MKKLAAVMVCLLFASVSWAGSFEDINWMTEDYPPYNFEEGGVKKGIAVDILLEIWKKIGLNKGPDAIKFGPWARGVQAINTQPGTCLFGTTLTAERRDQLGWKYVLSIPQVVEDGSGNHLIARKSAGLKFGSIEEVKNYDKNIGVVRGDVGEGLVLGAGVDKVVVDQSSDPDALIRKLDAGRNEVISYGYSTVISKMKEMGIDTEQYEIVFTFPPSPMGYAFHKDTDPALLEQFQKALDELNEDGTTEKIRAKYVN